MRKESIHVEKDILIREDGILLTCSTIRPRIDATLYRIINIVKNLPSRGRWKSDPLSVAKAPPNFSRLRPVWPTAYA